MCPHLNQSVPLLGPSQNGMSQKQKSVTQHTAGFDIWLAMHHSITFLLLPT
jgi:hypothetical protein